MPPFQYQRLLLVILTFGYSVSTFGQDRKTKEDAQLWFQYFLNLRFNEKWTLVNDAGYRRTEQLVHKPSLWFVRSGLQYQLNNDYAVTAGYTFFMNYADRKHAQYYRQEHRPWLRFTMVQKRGKLQIQHRYRAEMRNIQDGDDFGILNTFTSYYRFGYQLSLQYHFNGTKPGKNVAYTFISDELFVHFGQSIANAYDQNRIFVGFGYGISESTNVAVGYQYAYQQRASDNFEKWHTIRLHLIQNIDFKKIFKPEMPTDEN
jgi:hypothetical protein